LWWIVAIAPNPPYINPPYGRRVGTLQGFKGLEADVIILVGLDDQATSHPEWLYVGASRAKVALYALFLESTIGLMTTLV
jgi:hypothetical protein